ncbi:MAG: hypothetical protein CSA26_03425 [Desulfobacterales bacterium]|nr:MAG: hypothetical protein CSA26_03425 [Desulfobacterales bacterium]
MRMQAIDTATSFSASRERACIKGGSFPSVDISMAARLENVPDGLKALPQWIGWKFKEVEGRTTKAPCGLGGALINPVAPEGWVDFSAAAAAIEEAEISEEAHIDGIGFSIADSDPFTCIDIDHCLDSEGGLDGFSNEVVERFNSYTEVSPSGEGVHIWIKGNWAASPRQKFKGGELEIYSCKRYMTVTGNVYLGAPIEDRQQVLDMLLNTVSTEGAPETKPSVDNKKQPVTGAQDYRTIVLDGGPLKTPGDADLIKRIKNSKQGASFTALMEGSDARIANDKSTADQSLCNILAYWTRGDTRQMDRIWRASALGAREKWSREDYRQRTISHALVNVIKEGTDSSVAQSVIHGSVNVSSDNSFFTEKEYAWGEPLPVCLKSEAAPYPLDSLPETMRAAVKEVQVYHQMPVEMIAQSAIMAASIAAQGHINVARKESLTGPVSLSMLTVADSGERKSTCDGLFLFPIKEYQERLRIEYREEKKKQNAALGAWKSIAAGIKSTIKRKAEGNKDTRKEEERLLQHEQNKPAPAKDPIILLGDETPENLAQRLCHKWPCSAIVSSEGGVILGAHGMKQDSIMLSLALLNILWSGEGHHVGRKTTGNISIDGERLGISLMIQPKPLQMFFEKAGGLEKSSGFLARFLVCHPVSTKGTRFDKKEPESWPNLERFYRKLEAILDVPLVFTKEGKLDPVLMKLQTDAYKVWADYHDSVEKEMGPKGVYRDISETASKSAENAARLAAVFQLFEDGNPYGQKGYKEGSYGFINPENMQRGATLARWYLDEALRFFVEIERTREEEDALQLERWLIERYQQGVHRESRRVANRELFSRKLDRLEGAIYFLAERNRLRVSKEGKSILLEINPQVLSETEQN